MPLILDGTTGIVANNIADYAVTTTKLANNSITVAKMGHAGAVLQAVSTQSTTQVSVTSSNTSIGLSASITVQPSSKVLVLTVVPWYESGTGTWSNAGSSRLYQNGSLLAFSEHTGTTPAEAAAWTNPLNYMTGSLTAGTYTFEVTHGITIGGTHVCMRDGRMGSIMLLEIAG